jgi:hypothetical protein
MPCTDAGVAIISGVQYVISIKGYSGRILDTAHACKTHKKWRVKSKTKQIIPTILPVSWPNLNSQNLIPSKLPNILTIKMTEGMRSIYITLKGPSVLQKIERNRAVLFRTHFTTIWRSKIHANLKVEADVLNGQRRRFCVRHRTYHIYQGQRRQYAYKCACVYGVCSVKNKIANDCTSNLT